MKTYTVTKTEHGFLLNAVDTVPLGWFADEADARYAQQYMEMTEGQENVTSPVHRHRTVMSIHAPVPLRLEPPK